jgi:hypothetical protein
LLAESPLALCYAVLLSVPGIPAERFAIRLRSRLDCNRPSYQLPASSVTIPTAVTGGHIAVIDIITEAPDKLTSAIVHITVGDGFYHMSSVTKGCDDLFLHMLFKINV